MQACILIHPHPGLEVRDSALHRVSLYTPAVIPRDEFTIDIVLPVQPIAREVRRMCLKHSSKALSPAAAADASNTGHIGASPGQCVMPQVCAYMPDLMSPGN